MADSKVSSNYKLIRKLGSGAFGEIFLATHLKTNQEVAIKFENASSSSSQLLNEAKLYQYLLKDSSTPDKGIPQVYYCGAEGEQNVMVMDLLGQSLEDLFSSCGRKFSLKTVLMVGEQMLSRIEYVHSRYLLHRDIKPDNFMMGLEKKQHKVYIIDFGLAKRYIGKDGKFIPYREGKKLVGTARYASIGAHLGLEQGRKDDLESLGYVMVYFLKGSLPWQNIKATNKNEKYQKIMEMKLATSIETLCKGLPIEFSSYFSHCRNIKFEEKPDYGYLKGLLKDLFIKSCFEWDYEFDWKSIQKKEEKRIAIEEKVVVKTGALKTTHNAPQESNKKSRQGGITAKGI